MEHGRRLLGALEVAGAAFFAAGLALRTAHRRLMATHQPPRYTLKGKTVVVITTDGLLGQELATQLVDCGSRVVCCGSHLLPSSLLPSAIVYYCCDASNTASLQLTVKKILADVGLIDVVIWTSDIVKSKKTQLDQFADIVNNNLLQHLNVVSKFLPVVAKNSGHFVTVDPHGLPTGSFASSGMAVSALADSITHQIANSSGTVHLTRVYRRPSRGEDVEDVRESAGTILRAVEVGDSSVLLPSATKHIKNTLRYFFGELSYIWNQITTRHKELKTP